MVEGMIEEHEKNKYLEIWPEKKEENVDFFPPEEKSFVYFLLP